MKSTTKAHSDLSSLGMNKVSHLPNSRDKTRDSQELKMRENLSPKEQWQQKEKQLKLKGLLLLLLTQLFWLLIVFGEDDTQTIHQPKNSIQKDHELIKLPARVYSQIPKKGEKVAVSIFINRSKKNISAYLRGLEEDPFGSSGTKALLEVPKDQLNYIKNNDQIWLVFPPMQTTTQTSKRSIYEIDF